LLRSSNAGGLRRTFATKSTSHFGCGTRAWKSSNCGRISRTRAEFLEHPIAKATYNKSKRLWRVFWMRADLKWHSYQPIPAVASIEEFLAVVDEDPDCCFFG
jgi:hypothetical protein